MTRNYLTYSPPRLPDPPKPKPRTRDKFGDINPSNPPNDFMRFRDAARKYGVDHLDLLRAARNQEIDTEFDRHNGRWVSDNSKLRLFIRRLRADSKRRPDYWQKQAERLEAENKRLVEENRAVKKRISILTRDVLRRDKTIAKLQSVWVSRILLSYRITKSALQTGALFGVSRSLVTYYARKNMRRDAELT